MFFRSKAAFTRKSQNVARLAGSVLTVPFTVPVVPILMFGTYIGRVPRLVLIFVQYYITCFSLSQFERCTPDKPFYALSISAKRGSIECVLAL